MKKTTLVATALVTVFTASSATAWWGESGRGGCDKGAGYKSEYREHRGKAKRGEHGMKFQQHMNRELSAGEVKTLQEARLIYLNNPNITVGSVTATDNGFNVTIVTKENQSLVEEFELAKNGMRLERYEAIEKRLNERNKD